MCKERGILFHTDCVQAAGCHAIDTNLIGCDYATISGHKIYAPKGIGAIYVRDKSMARSLIYGGSNQEFGLRGGTENVASIVGLFIMEIELLSLLLCRILVLTCMKLMSCQIRTEVREDLVVQEFRCRIL